MSESATLCGSFDRKTLGSKSSALLCCVTRADQRLFLLRSPLYEDRFALFDIIGHFRPFGLLPPIKSSRATAIPGLRFRAIHRSTVIALALLFAFHCGNVEYGRLALSLPALLNADFQNQHHSFQRFYLPGDINPDRNRNRLSPVARRYRLAR